MSEELISEYIDQPAIKAQTDFMVAEVNRVKISYETLKKLRLDIGGAKPLSEISAGIKAADAETQKILKSQNLLNQAKIIEVRLANELLKQKKLQLEIDDKLARNAERSAKAATTKAVEVAPISITNLPAQEIERTGTAVNALDLAQAEAANSATAMGNANIINNKTIKETKQSSLELNKQLELKKQLDRQAAQELKNTVREENAVKGSLEQRRAALIRLNAVYDNQSPAERASAAGQRLQKIIGGLDTQVKTLESTTGRSQRNVGNYAGAFDKVKDGASKAFGALRTLANIIPGLGIGGIFLLGYEAISAFVSAVVGSKAPLFDFKETIKTIAAVNEEAAKSAGKEAGQLKILRAEIESTNVPMKTRLQAVKDIKEQYPEYFKGLTNEQILTGNVANAYELAAAAILKKARAQAAANEIEKIAGEKLAIQLKSEEKRQKAIRDFVKAESDAAVSSGGTIGGGNFGGVSQSQKRDAIVKNQREDAKADQAQIDQLNKKQEFLLKFAIEGAEQTVKLDKEKKASRDKSLADLKDSISTEFEIYKLQQDAKIKAFDTDIRSDKTHYLDKLVALDEYYKASNELIIAQFEEDTRRAKLAASNDIQNLEKDKAGKNPQQIARINENIKIAEQNLQQQLLLIQAQAQEKGNQLLLSTAETRNKITEDYLKKEKDYYEEFAKFEQDSIDKTTERYKKGLEKRLAQEKEFAEKQKQLLKDLNDKKVGFALEAEKVLFAIGAGSFTRQLNAIKEEQDAVDIKKEKELAANDALVQSEQDKAANIIIINERANIAKQKLDRESREIQSKQARFERAQQVFEILIGTVKSVAAIKLKALELKAASALNPLLVPLIPLVLAQIPFAIGSGAASAAALLATPLPRFKHGKGAGNNYEGPAIVNDGNTPEVIQHADGTFTFPQGKNVITHVKHDDQIYTSHESWKEAMLKAAHRDINSAMRMPAAKSEDKVGSAMAMQTKLLQQIANKRELNLNASDGGMKAIWKWGAKEVRYINDQTNWD